MLHTLQHLVGLSGKALGWFESYLSGRKQCTLIGGVRSNPTDLKYGVPQGSVLGPALFSLYTLPLGKVIADAGMTYHMYADDTQVYLPVSFKDAQSVDDMKETVNRCTGLISSWMSKHFLKLNAEKTEILLVRRPSPSRSIVPSSVLISDCLVACSTSARNLGVIFDEHLSMNDHITSVCKRAFYQIHLISRVRMQLTEEATKTLIQANVISLLDYCNCLLAGLPDTQINRLQRVQNCAARLIKLASRLCHITPILQELHWLPIKFRVAYKVDVFTHKRKALLDVILLFSYVMCENCTNQKEIGDPLDCNRQHIVPKFKLKTLFCLFAMNIHSYLRVPANDCVARRYEYL